MDELYRTLHISASGLKAQGTRLRVVSENIANANSLPTHPGDMPYRRKVVTFKNVLDREMGVDRVKVSSIRPDMSELKKVYDPQHPASDVDGYVLTPNVNSLIEVMDMREAQRSYDANLNVIKSSKQMLNATIDILR